MQFKINLPDIKLLSKLILNDSLAKKLAQTEKSGEFIAKGIFPTGKYLIDLSEEEIDLVVDYLSDHFMAYGLDNDGEPNSLGIQLEALIDIFNRGATHSN
ncbi:hypothetical protein [Algicola sagamiensis]|uniref:hypothetical protein n=1 Tax=Algicola sagamiensis TaxID=163869 RepID=UPI0003747235|nr:hypothetical protein [Algicola sagamiensis]